MLNTPYDDLMQGDDADAPTDIAEGNRSKCAGYNPTLSPDDNFAAWVVEYLFDRYRIPRAELFEVKKRKTEREFLLVPRILSCREELTPNHDEAKGALYPELFSLQFGLFPLILGSYTLKSGELRRLTIPALLAGSEPIPGMDLFDSLKGYLRYHGSKRGIAVVLGGWKHHVPIEDCPVIHEMLPMKIDKPGGHVLMSNGHGIKRAFQRFGSLLDQIDARYNADMWKEEDWRDLVWGEPDDMY
jgi:hypothetical protein